MDSVDAALRFLQRQFASVAHEESQWNDERLRLQQQVKELEQQRAVQEEAYKEALLRIKMLEFALRQERGRYLVSAAPVSSSANANTRKPENLPVNRPASATVVRGMDRSPPPSPTASPREPASQVSRSDSLGTSKPPPVSKGLEITRPRIVSRTASAGEASVDVVQEVPKNVKPATIAVAPKAAFRPHKLKLKLASHLDAIRSLAFHPTEPILVTGSEDCSVKVWNLGALSVGPTSQRPVELDSQLTVRSHCRSVLSVAMFSSENFPNTQSHCIGAFASSGRDGNINLFHLAALEDKADPVSYEDYQTMKAHGVKRAHEDCVWDLHAHPLSNVLFSAGADCIVRTWGVGAELALKSELKCSTKSHSRAVGHNIRGYLVPTSVHTLLTDTKTCAIGYTNGAIAQFDFHGEQLVQLLRASDLDSTSRDSKEAQVNQVVAHPTLPICIAAHQDKRLRIYDIRAGECVSTIVAHQDAVSSVSIDSAGLHMVTGGHDGSLRVWSIAERHCVFEQSAHRPKFNEALHRVLYHPSRNFIASGGADGLVKVFQ